MSLMKYLDRAVRTFQPGVTVSRVSVACLMEWYIPLKTARLTPLGAACPSTSLDSKRG